MPNKYTEKERILKFWDRVNITGLLDCAEWTGAKNRRGYGVAWNGENTILAHRFAWELIYGAIPDGLYVLHKCDNPSCCNTSHLFLGTHADNQCDKINKGRQSRGTDRYFAKLSDADIPEIRSLLKQGVVQTLIAKKYEVSRRVIGKIKQGKAWKHIG